MFILILCLLFPVGLCRDTYFSDVSGHNYDTFLMRHSSPRSRRATPAVTQDHHLYYRSEFYPQGKFESVWNDISLNHTYRSQLSNGYYRYYPVDLQFRFPFYGHFIQAVAITTHGFLSTADILHRNIHLTQYIAPFSADFNPSASSGSNIYYLSLPHVFIAQWSNVYLETNRGAGGFTFQVQLTPNGDITFAYKRTPLTVQAASKHSYESFYGIADGFVLNSSSLLYLYSYHSVSLPADSQLEGSVYVIRPLDNCVSATSREGCNATSCNTSFTCGWCPSLGLCSDGYDRQRQNWDEANCDETSDVFCEVPGLEASSGAAAAVVVVVVVVVLLLLCVPAISLLIVSLVVWRAIHYRRGGSFLLWSRQTPGDNQIAPEKSDHIILREADDAM